MESLKIEQRQEIEPKDISEEFLTMDPINFLAFLRNQRNEPALTIIIDWAGVSKARQLKVFLEDSDALRKGQKRTAVIRATEEQYGQEPNVFASGVRWEKVEE